METKIEALDKLLGTHLRRNQPQVKRPSDLEPKGIIALIRGAAGSGKTTLSLQILAEHLKKSAEKGALLISLEVSPNDALFAARGKLPDRLNEALTNGQESNRLVLVSQEELEKHFSSGDWEIVKTDLENFFPKKLNSLKDPIIVLDSMNVLANMAQSHMTPRGGTIDLRMIVHQMWKLLRGHNATLIITEEFHPHGAGIQDTLLSESFTCDIEIVLAPEPIAGHSTIPPSMVSVLGYTIERRLSEEPVSTKPQSIEIRSFCRVLKSRYTPNQSRRCAYDIVAGKGVVFDETFAGDGSILLYEENQKQRALWEEFITRDIPLQFPALRYALFDRPGLQRTFATQRPYTRFPKKIDVYVACFDTYWINWYWQLCQRSAIREAVLKSFVGSVPPLKWVLAQEATHPSRQQIARSVCAIDSAFTDFLAFQTEAPNFKNLTRRICYEYGQKGTPKAPRLDETALKAALENCWKDIHGGRIGFLHVLPGKELRLFGEFESKIIGDLEFPPLTPKAKAHSSKLEEELNKPETEPKRKWKMAKELERLRLSRVGAHRPKYLRERREDFLSVPYNANVSFLVFRNELLQAKLRRRKEGLLTTLREICREQNEAFKEFRQHFGPQEAQGIDFEARLEQWIIKAYKTGPNIPEKRMPETWEEIIAFCDIDPPQHLLLETQTFDSFLCAFLECFWGTGDDLEIKPSYTIPGAARTGLRANLFRALYLLCIMFERGTLETNSTLDVHQFVKRFSQPTRLAKKARRDWLFARHWYSTLVDVLTAQGENTKRYLWQPKKNVELEIMPLPYHLSSALEDGKERLDPVACWGEWHLAVLAGSENEALAVELINNLMSSRRICERANSCAALPTVEEFYKRYGSDPCLHLPERADIGIPKMTYNELRERIFKHARSRNQVFDYHHCMRELHAVLSYVQKDPPKAKRELGSLIDDALSRIEKLKSYDMAIH